MLFQKWSLDPVSYTHSDAADEGLGVDLGGRRIIKKKKSTYLLHPITHQVTQLLRT